jgi:hypothetical protein
VPWQLVLIASYVGVNLALIPQKIQLGPDVGVDWQIMRALPGALSTDSVYELDVSGVRFIWSPVMAWVMAAIATIGYWPWVAIHVGAAFLVRRPLMIGLILVSYAFWFDAAQGNVFVFVVVAAVLAIQGSRGGKLAFLVLMTLMPRPLGLPLAVWLLWTDRTLVRPTALWFVIHFALVFVSGDLVQWLAALAAADVTAGVTLGPTAWFGRWWLVAGVPIALWLARHGRLGWAGMAVSPYLTPQYLLWPLVELAWRSRSGRSRQEFDSRTQGLVVPTAADAGHEQEGDIVIARQAPASVLGRPGNEGSLRRQEDRVGAVGVQE